ncbi:hypothetical protein NL676_034789 [Syzygium grande]|nr:hypothetical protein NL676_034789 [Syzygium grande]
MDSEDQESRTFDFEEFIKRLERMPFPSNGSSFLGHEADSFIAGITSQVTAVGLWQSQQQNEGISALIEKIVKHEQDIIKRQREEFDPAEELDEMKVYMTFLEWYTNICRANGQGPGYYDSFKNARERRDNGVDKYKTYLTDYWEKVVDQAEKKPLTRGVPLRPRLLFAGTNYRRTVEPLDIAEYYRRGRKDYLTHGRSKHYEQLQRWLEDHQNSQNAGEKRKETRNNYVTKDSCFWARVEEAIRSCRRPDRDRTGEEAKLKQFEEDVMYLINNRKVSPDIFLERSSYMQWWREYAEISKKVKGGSDSHPSELVNYMKNGHYITYV